MCKPFMEIKRNKQGYYTMFINGIFEGNYDSYTEASKAYEEIQLGEASMRELVNACAFEEGM